MLVTPMQKAITIQTYHIQSVENKKEREQQIIFHVSEEIENSNKHANKDINLVIKSIFAKKNLGQMVSLTNSTKCQEISIILSLSN